MKKIDITVLMPVYNGDKYLKKAIDSILEQSFKNFELLLINDGSTDNSQTIIDSYSDNRIKVVLNEKNIGLINTLNKGLKLSKGKYVCRFDCDDISMPDRLMEQFLFLERNPSHVLVGSNVEIINECSKRVKLKKYPEMHDEIMMGMMFSNQICHPAVMFKNICTEHSLFYSSAAVHFEDYEFWSRLSDFGLFHNIQKNLIKYREHSTQISIKHKKKQDDSIYSTRSEFVLKRKTSLTPSIVNRFITRSKTKDVTPGEFNNIINLLNDKEKKSKVISTFFWRKMCNHADFGLSIIFIAVKSKLSLSLKQAVILLALALVKKRL